jgi:predicted dehydrogenase
MRRGRIIGLSFERAPWVISCARSTCATTPIAGVRDNDKARMTGAVATFSIPSDRVYGYLVQCVREEHPDCAILCPATARQADVVEEVAALGVDVRLEKPFGPLADADRILAAVAFFKVPGLYAIDDDREPLNSARDNLSSLKLCAAPSPRGPVAA